MKKIALLSVFLLTTLVVTAQELNCQVQVIQPTVQGSNTQVYEDMQKSIYELMNTTKWTSDVIKLEERIDCTLLITISNRVSNDQFTGSIQVTSSRPIFRSDYSSKVLNLKDNDFKIRYLQNSRIQFTPGTHRDNLASILAFYAYLIIGTDYDTFAPEGGTQYFNLAQQIVNNAQGAGEPGWKAHDGLQNRYWVIDNILHRQFKPLRQAYYTYHRLGMDKLYDDPDAGRVKITEGLEAIKKVHQVRPGSYNVQIWFTSKVDEIVNIYKKAHPQEKTRIFNLLKQIDAAHLSQYQKILSSK